MGTNTSGFLNADITEMERRPYSDTSTMTALETKPYNFGGETFDLIAGKTYKIRITPQGATVTEMPAVV